MVRSLTILVLLSMVSIFGVLPAQAADGDGKFKAKGVGAQNCATFLGFDSADRLVAETWWAGYVTAINIEYDDTYDLLPNMQPPQVNRWLRGYCQDNPNQLFSVAVHKMVEYFFANRAQRAPKP